MSSKIRKLVPYWIIIHNQRKIIWKNPYMSLEMARVELATQAIGNPNHGWTIEQREFYIEEDDTAGIKDFFDF